MAFLSLYRKHRPQTFGELVGQEAVSTALLLDWSRGDRAPAVAAARAARRR